MGEKNSMQGTSRIKFHLLAFLWSFAGLVLVYGGVVALNELSSPPEKQKRTAAAEIQIQHVTKPKPKKVVKKKAQPKPQLNRLNPPPAPLLGLGSSLSGVNFGLPEFQLEEFSAPTEQLLGNTEDVTMTGETVDVPPILDRQKPVEYPKLAKKQGLEGFVLLNMLIDKNGNVGQVQVLQAHPEGIFEEAAKNGVRDWIFQPARYKGKNVHVWARQKIQFQLG